MKNFSLLLLIASTLLFTRCAKNEISLDPIPPEPYSKPLVVEKIFPNGDIYARTIYTYNSEGLETSIKTGETYERTNYKYEGKRSSYTDIWCDYHGKLLSQTECVKTFGDTKYTRPLKIENVTTDKDGKREREIYTYNSEGLEVSYKKYSDEALISDRINYKYEAMKSSYTEVHYTVNGEKVSLRTCAITFEDPKYKRPLIIEYVNSSPYDDTKHSQREVFTYNVQGLVTSHKKYGDDKLVSESRDYTYGDKESSYIDVSDGISGIGMKINTTYLY